MKFIVCSEQTYQFQQSNFSKRYGNARNQIQFKRMAWIYYLSILKTLKMHQYLHDRFNYVSLNFVQFNWV